VAFYKVGEVVLKVINGYSVRAVVKLLSNHPKRSRVNIRGRIVFALSA